MRTAAKGRHALVLGGGVAGLLSAGVLARHFEAVTVVERDAYPTEPGVRPHAPQGAHVHILLAKGLDLLSTLARDFERGLDEMGLHRGDLTDQVRMAYGGAWLPRARSGIPFRPCTRPQVEHLLRRDVICRENVTILSEHRVESLMVRGPARGAMVSSRDGTREIHADLIVDATGRTTRSPEWLAAAGTTVVEETVDPGVVYTSCMFEAPGPLPEDWMLLAVSGQVPNEPNMGALMRLGHRRLLGAYISYGKPKPPRSVDEYLERTAALCVPELHRVLSRCRPLGEPVVFGNIQNRWRHYGRLRQLPEGFVGVGDAVCSMNPRYGQGMTLAGISATQLDTQLTAHFQEHGSLAGFALRFHRAMEDILKIPWQMALMEDRLWVSVFSGHAPGLVERLLAQASARVLRAAFSNINAFIQFMRVAHLLDTPTSLLNLQFLAALLRREGGRASACDAPSTTFS